MEKQQKIYDYAINNWPKLCRIASSWPGQKRQPVSIADQLKSKFECDYSTASRIARDVAAMKNCGIV